MTFLSIVDSLNYHKKLMLYTSLSICKMNCKDNTAKKQAFTVRKTKVEFTENVAIYYRLPVFCLRKIRRFLRVFASVNPSIRYIIR